MKWMLLNWTSINGWCILGVSPFLNQKTSLSGKASWKHMTHTWNIWVYPIGHQLWRSPADWPRISNFPRMAGICVQYSFIFVESAILKTKYCRINSNHRKPNQTCLFLFASKKHLWSTDSGVIHGLLMVADANRCPWAPSTKSDVQSLIISGPKSTPTMREANSHSYSDSVKAPIPECFGFYSTLCKPT